MSIGISTCKVTKQVPLLNEKEVRAQKHGQAATQRRYFSLRTLKDLDIRPRFTRIQKKLYMKFGIVQYRNEE